MVKISKKIKDAFGGNYTLTTHEDGYILYDKTRKGQRSNSLYLGKFCVKGKEYIYNNNSYKNVEDLILAMEEYNKTLPFDAELYNPMFRKNYCVECAIHDYLTSLGFERSKKIEESDIYCLKDFGDQNICTVKYTVKEDSTEGSVYRLIPNTPKWTQAEFKDLDSAIGACNSIVVTYCIGVNIVIDKVFDNITNARATQMLDNVFDYRSGIAYSEDSKKKLIERLEKELKYLKNE